MDTNEALQTIARSTAGIVVAIDTAVKMVNGLAVQHRESVKVPAVRQMLKTALPALTRLRDKCDEVIALLES